MPRITDYDRRDFPRLLAGDSIDASRGVLFQNPNTTPIPPNFKNISILIGLGGMGIQTLDKIKEALTQHMAPGWENFIGFLAIDSDYNDLEAARYLSPNERICITDPYIPQRIHNSDLWPSAWRSFADPNATRTLPPPGYPSAHRSRLLGKLKIHDKPTAQLGFDEQIVERLDTLKRSMCSPSRSGIYQVYVIGGIGGGTGGGTLLEMPALIRQAIQDPRLSTYAMLYLPDTIASMAGNPHGIVANGFATLKELDYFSGLRMRRDTKECWGYNFNALPKLEITSEQKFYEIPFLIGTSQGNNRYSAQEAIETVTKSLVTILEDEPLSFRVSCHAAQNAQVRPMDVSLPRPAPGTRHSVPNCYGALGYAQSTVPAKTVHAYIIGQICKKAGIADLSREDWEAAAAAAGAGGMVPFRGENCYLNANEGTQKARAIVAPLERLLKEVIFNGRCNLAEEFLFDWDTVKNQRMYDDPAFLHQINTMHERVCDYSAEKELAQKIRQAYTQFMGNVHQYVLAEGPLAYVILYDGRFIPSGGNLGMGIKDMLRNLCAGRRADGSPYPVCPVKLAEEHEASTRETMIKRKLNALELARKLAGNDDPSGTIENWKYALEAVVVARINEERGKIALGHNNIFDVNVLRPAALLRDNLQSFGYVLNSMASIYEMHGHVVDNFEEFNYSSDNASQVNLAGFDTNAYSWVKCQADNIIAAASPNTVRGMLVASFFNPQTMDRWLYIPEDTVKNESGKVTLQNKDVPIPAREIFDSVIAQCVPNNLSFSIESLFNQVAVSDSDYDELAQRILRALARKSKPLFNGHYPEQKLRVALILPNSLNYAGTVGTRILHALENEAYRAFGFAPVDIYYGNDTDSIHVVQYVTGLELYNLKELNDWEKVYETRLTMVQHMHGYSPSAVCTINDRGEASYADRRPWEDYPSPCVYEMGAKNTRDPMTHQISREGERQLAIDKIIAQARELGLLYAEKTQPDGWEIRCCLFSRGEDDWKFDISRLSPQENGFYPTGRKLVEAVAEQNQKSLADITQIVRLDSAGLLSHPAPSEDLAWEFAAEVLYVHIPLLDDLTASVNWFREALCDCLPHPDLNV
jgi:hypothetical protein